LLLAHVGKEGRSENVVPKISQETLAEMIGTTRARVNFFMNRFRQLGFIDYNGGLEENGAIYQAIRNKSIDAVVIFFQQASGSMSVSPLTTVEHSR
jgi:hypothetical protein